jgi:hypothetical protein
VPDTEPLSPLSKRIARATRRAMLYAFIERLWPRLVVAGSVLGVFLSLSWLGLWPVMPDIVRFALLGLLALAFLASLVWAARTPRVGREQGVSRVEAASGLKGRPLSALEDVPFDTRNPQGQALWQAHQARMAKQGQTLGRRDARAAHRTA